MSLGQDGGAAARDIVLPPGYDRRSGLHVAAEAHDAGVVDQADPQPLHDVHLQFVMQGERTLVNDILVVLEEHVVQLPGVDRVMMSRKVRT